MGMTIVEKIIALHSTYAKVKSGEIVDIQIDLRTARDNGGVNIIKQLRMQTGIPRSPPSPF